MFFITVVYNYPIIILTVMVVVCYTGEGVYQLIRVSCAVKTCVCVNASNRWWIVWSYLKYLCEVTSHYRVILPLIST